MLPDGLRLPVFVLFFIASIVACAPNVNLSAVRQYATMAQQAQASFDAIAEDYDASCARQRELNLQLNDLVWFPYGSTQTPPLAPASTSSTGAKPGPTPFFGASQERCVATADYDSYPLGQVSNEWKSANDTLLAYVQSLGALAGATATPSPAIPTFIGAAAAANLIPKPQATALTAFATAIFNYWQSGRRERQVASFLDATNAVDPKTGQSTFSQAIDALTIAGEGYQIIVFNECTDVADLYIDALKNLGATTRPSNRALAIERAYRMRRRWSADASTCNAHYATAQAYIATLQKLSSTNEALYKAVQQPASSKDALEHDLSDLGATISSFYTLVTTRAGAAPPSAKSSASVEPKKSP
jgi:hypothetical protein